MSIICSGRINIVESMDEISLRIEAPEEVPADTFEFPDLFSAVKHGVWETSLNIKAVREIQKKKKKKCKKVFKKVFFFFFEKK